jgi:cystathionine beta-lyase family protein involved in aluminum resistance
MQVNKQKPIVVLVEMVHGTFQYKINSVLVQNPLLTLSRLEETHGQNYPVIAIVDSRLPFDLLRGVIGMAGKAQLSIKRCYIFYADVGTMGEIKFGSWLPFSVSPPDD